MATSVLGVSESHYRSVTVTSLASLAGIVAGLASQAATAAAANPSAAATDSTGLYIFVALTLVQYPILYALGIDVEDFSKKDHLYVGFMTFSMWFVTWAILLTADTPI